MTPLAYVLIVVIPLVAFATVALAYLPTRPAPGRTMGTPAITARIEEIDRRIAADPGSDEVRPLRRERSRLQTELMRRGLGRWPGK